jgi:hypothetical protein
MTYAFSTSGNFWKTRYSFEPDCYGASENYFVSFLPKALTGATGADLCWIHNTNQTRNSFYGDLYPSTISVVSNENPSAEKAYRALSIESNQNVFKAKVSTNLDLPDSSVTKPQTAEVRSFDAREEALYAAIGPSKTNSKKNVKVIGSIAALTPFSFGISSVGLSNDNGYTNIPTSSPVRPFVIRINALDSNEVSLNNAAVAFELGNSSTSNYGFYYFKYTNGAWVQIPFNAEDCYEESSFRVASFRSNPGVALGTFLTLMYPGSINPISQSTNPLTPFISQAGQRRIIAVYDPELDGDPIRGRYARIDIETQADGKPFELLAVNTEYSMSNLDASK